MILVEIALGGVHRDVVAPRLRYEHHHGVFERAPGREQRLERVVERGGVALGGRDYGRERGGVVAQNVGAQRLLARRHPVDVALQRVYLAVVDDVAVRMRQPPRAERVGREARVDERERRYHGFVPQVRVEVRELMRHYQPLIYERPRGQPAYVEVARLGEVVAENRLLRALADYEEAQVELAPGGGIVPARHEELLYDGHCSDGENADFVRVDGNFAPREQTLAFVGDRALDGGFAVGALGGVLGKERHAHAVIAFRRQGRAQLAETRG